MSWIDDEIAKQSAKATALEPLPEHPSDYFAGEAPSPLFETVPPHKNAQGIRYNAAFGVPMGASQVDDGSIDRHISRSPMLMEQLNRMDGAMKTVSTIGAYSMYSERDRSGRAKKLPQAAVDAIANHYHSIGLISDEELAKYRDVGGKALPAWAMPAPSYFYDETFMDVARNAVGGFAAGVNSSFASMFAGVEWLGGESWVGKGAKAVSDWFDENARVTAPGRPSFIADLSAGFGSMAAFMAPGLAISRGIQATAKVSRGLAAFLDVTLPSASEALAESGAVFKQRFAETQDRNLAERSATLTFWANMPLLIVTNRLLLSGGRFAALKGAMSEGTQEAAQTAISNVALLKPITANELAYSYSIGFIVGGGTGKIFSYAESKSQAIPPLSEANKQLYRDVAATKIAEGMTLEQAHVEATKAVAATPDGAQTIIATGEAATATMKAEASIGRNIPEEDVVIVDEAADVGLAQYANLTLANVTEKSRQEWEALVEANEIENLRSMTYEDFAAEVAGAEREVLEAGQEQDILLAEQVTDDEIVEAITAEPPAPARPRSIGEMMDLMEKLRIPPTTPEAIKEFKPSGELIERLIEKAPHRKPGTPERLSFVVGKPGQVEFLESRGITDKEEQIRQIINDSVKAPKEHAEAFRRLGDIEQAEALERQAEEAGAKLKEADGALTEAEVNRALGKEVSQEPRVSRRQAPLRFEESLDELTEDAIVKGFIDEMKAARREGRAEGIEIGKARLRERVAQLRQQARLTKARSSLRDLWAREERRQQARLDRIDKKNEKTIKRALRGDVGKIDVEYQKQLNSALKGYQAAAPSQKTLDKLRAMAEWVENNATVKDPDGTERRVVVSDARLAALKRLTDKPVSKMLPSEKAELAETISVIKEMGKLALADKEGRAKEELQRQIDEISAQTKNFDFESDAANLAMEAHLKTQYAMRITDEADGGQHYRGANSMLLRQAFELDHDRQIYVNNYKQASTLELIKETGIKKLTRDMEARMSMHIRYAEGAYDAAAEIMQEYGYAVPETETGYIDEARLLEAMPPLSGNEQKFIEILGEYANKDFDRLAATYELSTNKMFPKLEGRVLPLKRDREQIIPARDDITVGEVDPYARRGAKTPQGFLVPRRGGGRGRVRIDIMNLFYEDVEAKSRYMYLQPWLDKSGKITGSEQYKQAAGQALSKWWTRRRQIIANGGYTNAALASMMESPRITKWMRAFRTDLTAVFMGGKLLSLSKQPLATLPAMATAGAHFGTEGAVRIGTASAKQWTIEGSSNRETQISKGLTLRGDAGDPTINDLAKKYSANAIEREEDKIMGVFPNFPEWIRKKTTPILMSGVRYFDLKTAAGAREGFRTQLEAMGLSKEDAAAEADMYMDLTQASSSTAMMSEILASGEGARTWFTLQSFMLAQWGVFTHDLLYNGMTEKDYNKKMNALLGLGFLFASGLGESLASRWYRDMLGKERRKNESIIADAMLQMLQMVPLAGNLTVAAIHDRSAGPPVVQIGTTLISGTKAALTGQKRKTRERGFTRAAEAASILMFRVPGTSQVFDIIEMAQDKP
jgi:hypothetical protein